MIAALAGLALASCAAPTALALAPAVQTPPPVCYVTNPADTGTGTLRDCLAGTSPTVTVQTATIDLASPASIARPVTLNGGGTIIVNHGTGDGLAVTADDVTITDLWVRGSDAGMADIGAQDAENLIVDSVLLGLDPVDVWAVPATHRTQGHTLRAVGGSNLTVRNSRMGWNESAYGNVVLWNVHGGRVEGNYIVGSSYGTAPVNTLDALSLLFGTSDVAVVGNTIDLTSSSSAIELHTADRITIVGNTLTRAARAGVTVFDVDGVLIAGNRMANLGTCGVAAAEPIGMYDGAGASSWVTIGANDIYGTVC